MAGLPSVFLSVTSTDPGMSVGGMRAGFLSSVCEAMNKYFNLDECHEILGKCLTAVAREGLCQINFPKESVIEPDLLLCCLQSLDREWEISLHKPSVPAPVLPRPNPARRTVADWAPGYNTLDDQLNAGELFPVEVLHGRRDRSASVSCVPPTLPALMSVPVAVPVFLGPVYYVMPLNLDERRRFSEPELRFIKQVEKSNGKTQLVTHRRHPDKSVRKQIFRNADGATETLDVARRQRLAKPFIVLRCDDQAARAALESCAGDYRFSYLICPEKLHGGEDSFAELPASKLYPLFSEKVVRPLLRELTAKENQSHLQQHLTRLLGLFFLSLRSNSNIDGYPDFYYNAYEMLDKIAFLTAFFACRVIVFGMKPLLWHEEVGGEPNQAQEEFLEFNLKQIQALWTLLSNHGYLKMQASDKPVSVEEVIHRGAQTDFIAKELPDLNILADDRDLLKSLTDGIDSSDDTASFSSISSMGSSSSKLPFGGLYHNWAFLSPSSTFASEARSSALSSSVGLTSARPPRAVGVFAPSVRGGAGSGFSIRGGASGRRSLDPIPEGP